MLIFIVMSTVIVVGLAATMLAEPGRPQFSVWNDETERRLLRERKIGSGWW